MQINLSDFHCWELIKFVPDQSCDISFEKLSNKQISVTIPSIHTPVQKYIRIFNIWFYFQLFL